MKAKTITMTDADVFRLRTKLKMTQRQFADLIGVDPITVSRWERGHTRIEPAMVSHIKVQTEEYKRVAR